MFRPAGIALGAALALAVDAARADAAAPVTDWGGELFLGAAVLAKDQAGTATGDGKSPAVQQDLFLHGSADLDLSDDLTVGAFAAVRVDELRRGTPAIEPDHDDPVRAAFLRLKREGWGELQIGHEADARVEQGLWAPQICDCLDGVFGTNSPVIALDASPGGTNSTTQTVDGRAVKLAWYAPSWQGLTFAVSWAPERVPGYPVDARDPPPGRRRDAALRQFVSAALVWQKVSGATTLELEAGLTHAGRAPGGGVVAGRNDGDPLIWDAGFNLSYAAWKFGAAYEQQNRIAASGLYGAAAFVPGGGGGIQAPDANALVNRTVDCGFTYAIGPVTAGIAWSRGLYEGLGNTAAPKAIATNDMVFAGARWGFRPHLDAIGGIAWNRYDPGSAGSASAAGLFEHGYSAFGPLLGLQARF